MPCECTPRRLALVYARSNLQRHAYSYIHMYSLTCVDCEAHRVDLLWKTYCLSLPCPALLQSLSPALPSRSRSFFLSLSHSLFLSLSHTHIHTNINTYIQTYKHTYIHTYTHMYVNTHVQKYTCTYRKERELLLATRSSWLDHFLAPNAVYRRTNTYAHTHTHTHTHTHIIRTHTQEGDGASYAGRSSGLDHSLAPNGLCCRAAWGYWWCGAASAARRVGRQRRRTFCMVYMYVYMNK